MAYNFFCRALYNLPWRASVSRHQVVAGISTMTSIPELTLATGKLSDHVWDGIIVRCWLLKKPNRKASHKYKPMNERKVFTAFEWSLAILYVFVLSAANLVS